MRPISERLDAMSIPEPNSGCVLFTGRWNRKGYGVLSIGRHKKIEAHRVAYELARGPIAAGLVVDHLCRVRACVNPDHLEAVTSRENTLRGTSFAAARARQSHCIHGHELSGSNLYVQSNGTRGCRKCRNMKRGAR